MSAHICLLDSKCLAFSDSFETTHWVVSSIRSYVKFESVVDEQTILCSEDGRPNEPREPLPRFPSGPS